MSKRTSIEDLRILFENRGCRLLSTEYNNCKEKLKYICECGNEALTSVKNFKRKHGCNKCPKIDQKQVYLDIKTKFTELGCELLEETYLNVHYKMKYRCVCGNISEISYSNWRRGKRCKKCARKRIGQPKVEIVEKIKKRAQFIIPIKDEIEKLLLDLNYSLINILPNQLTKYTKIELWCNKNHIFTTSLKNLIIKQKCPKCRIKENTISFEQAKSELESKGMQLISTDFEHTKSIVEVRCSNCNKIFSTKLCSALNNKGNCKCIWYIKGEKNKNWKHDKTLEDRLDDRSYEEYKVWRKAVYERDNYKCVICGKGNELCAHHLNAYLSYPDQRIDIDNGVTLCQPARHGGCHRDFHSKYGSGYNTKEQFIEYWESRKNGN